MATLAAMLHHLTRRRFLLQSLAAASLPAISIKSAGANVLNGRLPRMDLLRYRDRRGEVRRVESKSDWAKRRNEILRGMQEIMGPLPDHKKRLPVAMEIIDEVDGGTYVRRLISYGSEAESRTPAHLLIPKSALEKNVRAPAVLCLHPTDDKIGHDVVVGLGGKPNRAYAAELAERGFVALAPSYPLLAGYQPDLGGLGYHSGTMKAIWDNIRGLDLLESLHFVKRGGFGTIGHSLGGHNSVFTAVFDERLKVVVTSCGLDSFVDYYGGSPDVWKPERGWCQLRYMPRLLEYAGRLEEIPFDFPELIGALAPRVCFISAPTGDGNFKWESVDRIGRAARPVYELFGKSDNLIIEHPDCGHDFPDGIRSRAYSLLEKHLN